MEAMMSHLLASARANLTADRRRESPMDLSSNKGVDHKCERFVNQEDLRPESFLSQTSEADKSSDRSSVSESCVTADTHGLSSIYESNNSRNFSPSTTSAFRLVSKTKRDENLTSVAPVGSRFRPWRHGVTDNPKEIPGLQTKKPHPFSIATILGSESTDSIPYSMSAPAQVFSAVGILEQNYLFNPHYHVTPAVVHQPQPRTSTPMQEITDGKFQQSVDAYWCHACNEFCASKQEADRHENVHRSLGASCGLRRVIFKEHGYITTHEHTGYIDRIKCGLCSKVVANCFFSKHQQLHNGHVCEVCDHEFSTNSRLKDHVNVHTGSTPFACDLCNRKFAKRSSLTQHQRYHREYRSFQCQFCAKYFNSKYACAVHERLHTGDNPFKCDVPGCTREFPQKIQLRLHMNSHRKR